ncbi:MAG: AmmeMemoRadiSam system protein B [Verrucomicrobia bacterium]|jgi:MEMO1 family protein|nr:AmmeMemoRadiSam system protein B [Verrucomicrobiota bacterium]MBT7069078.1 AmmeMemoRadiSam system protein B [Verrucomicrobiota bacterium]MBT7700537.1 AmmeMemoRadiSam system protein B [Verrucomicrobiota bacterium]
MPRPPQHYAVLPVALMLACSVGGAEADESPREAIMNPKAEQRVHVTQGYGRWFPSDPTDLRRQINGYINAADGVMLSGPIVAAIAPHAGYAYSGPVAGHTFRAIRDSARGGHTPDTVVVLGLSHRGSPPGVALLDADLIRSPLGAVPIDRDTTTRMAEGRDRLHLDSAPHRGEHSAENEIPFLQVALPDTPLVVGIIGDHDPRTLKQLGEALKAIATTRSILVVASTDLLHDADYDKVTRTDKGTLKHIAALDIPALAGSWDYRHQVCCGIGPVLASMTYARAQGCTEGILLHYRNSGDDHPASRGEWVVGYGAVVFCGPRPPS